MVPVMERHWCEACETYETAPTAPACFVCGDRMVPHPPGKRGPCSPPWRHPMLEAIAGGSDA